MNQRRHPPPPPGALAAGRSCDAGHCDRPSTGWRWHTDLRMWLPTCDKCLRVKGVPPEFKARDQDRPAVACARCGELIALDRLDESCDGTDGHIPEPGQDAHSEPLTGPQSAEQAPSALRDRRDAPRASGRPA